MIPFFALALGASLDLHNVLQAGLPCVGLGLALVVLAGILLYFTDRPTDTGGMLFTADNLSGAADCAITFAGPGL
jgi:2-keto-3-deoxygluconate permease